VILVHRAYNLEGLEGSAHGFFGRTGGVSKGVHASLNCGLAVSDSPEHVRENRSRARTALDRDSALVTVHQVHGNRAVIVSDPWEPAKAPEADAMATRAPHVSLAILTADCAPVLLADPSAHVIAAAHAGWKGALAGIIESAIAAMEELGAKRDRIHAAIGPTISQANYEVGAELQSQFVTRSPEEGRYFRAGERPDRFQFDLEGLVARRLVQAGIGSVERLSLCTYGDEAAFFSHRRATHRHEPETGRQISMICLCK